MMNAPIMLKAADLYKFLKHRYPFLMLDAIEIHSPKHCVGIKNISFSDNCFVGHFPGHPVMPGVLQIEAMAQSACVLSTYYLRKNNLEYLTLFASIESVKFHKQVVPGDVLRIHTECLGSVGKIFRFHSIAYVGDDKVTEGKFMAALAPMEEYTFAIIKPNAFKHREHIVQIIKDNGLSIASYEENGIQIPAYKMAHWSYDNAGQFYAEHSARPFFKDLCEFISSDNIVTMVLQGKDAVSKWRNLMGATNPADAQPGTIRSLYGESIDFNAVHGSDSAESAKREIEIAFPGKFAI